MSAVLRLDGVSVRYGGTPALTGVDLTVGAGERVALVGPSGAGKSTLLGLVNGSVLPTAGSLEVLGADPA
ncbi:ABC transporter ATP-binding protein, partial [Modestobacter sp. VKM Ac-2676]